MKIALPITYRWPVFYLVFLCLFCFSVVMGSFIKGQWFLAIPFATIWLISTIPWFVFRVTITERSIAYRGFLGVKEMEWGQIRRIEMRQRYFIFQTPKRVEIGQGYWARHLRLTLVGNQPDDFIEVNVEFQTKDKMREMLAIIELRAPQAQKDPMVSKFFDRTIY